MAHKARWTAFFNNFDANKSGDIGLDDADLGIQKFAAWMKFKPGTPEYQRGADAYNLFLTNFIKVVDTSKDGKVSKQEFDVAVDKLVAGGEAAIPEWWKEAGVLLFNAIDTNKNGELSLQELSTYAKNIDPNLKEEDIKHAHEWAKATIGRPLIDSPGLMHLVWVWASDPNPRPELDIIFGYWK